MEDNKKIAEFLESTKTYFSVNIEAAITIVKNNIYSFTASELKEILYYVITYYKSLPVTGWQDLEDVIKTNKNKSKAKGYVGKGPEKRVDKDKHKFLEYVELITKGLTGDLEKFRNWSVILRGMEVYLLKLAEIYATYGNIGMKAVGQKGFFIFFFNRQQSERWLLAQKHITVAILEEAKKALKPGKRPAPPPKDYEGYLALFNKAAVLKQPTSDEWMAKCKDHFSNPKALTNLSAFDLACYMQAWLVIRPARALIDKKQIMEDGGTIPADWLNYVINEYVDMFVPMVDTFEVNKMNTVIPDQKELNEALGQRLSVIKNVCAAYRQVCFNATRTRLGPGEARKFAEAYSFVRASGLFQ